MHDSIKKFSLHGELADKVMVQAKERMTHWVENMMRDEGYAPSLDLDPQFTIDYQPVQERFTFDLSVYGVWVGKDESWRISGVTNGKRIMKPTVKNK